MPVPAKEFRAGFALLLDVYPRCGIPPKDWPTVAASRMTGMSGKQRKATHLGIARLGIARLGALRASPYSTYAYPLEQFHPVA